MMRFTKKLLLAAVALSLTSLQARADVIIGNWSASSRSWNSADMTILKALLTGQGFTVAADAAATSANLSGYSAFVIGEGTADMTPTELSALGAWVNGGGRLLVFYDSGESGNPFNNNILSGIGSLLSGTGSASVSPFASGNFATQGPPFNIVGQTLNTTPGTAINGGTTLAGSYLHFQAFGSGFVYAFGDRSDHNVFAPSASNTNGQLILNILSGASAPTSAVPEPGTLSLIAGGLVIVGVLRRRRNA